MNIAEIMMFINIKFYGMVVLTLEINMEPPNSLSYYVVPQRDLLPL